MLAATRMRHQGGAFLCFREDLGVWVDGDCELPTGQD